jgi:transposase-like protein
VKTVRQAARVPSKTLSTTGRRRSQPRLTPGLKITIESTNARLRKVTRNRGQFPSEQAVLKVLYLAVRNLEEFRSPNTGIRSSGWKQALQAFTIYFDGRIPTP